MDDTVRDLLHDGTLAARKLLINEITNLLEGVYGLHTDGQFEAATKLPAIQSLPEVAATRTRLETFLRDETAAGLSAPDAVTKLIKETAFTHLNRLVAFKMLETRKIIRGTIDRYHDSNAFKRYLVEQAPDDLVAYNAGDLPQNALGEGPRDQAYRHFLLWQCEQIAREVKILFDPSTLASQLFPRPRVLKGLIDQLNAAALQAAWQPGGDEASGWVYQYFNEEEKAEVFERLNKQKQKIRREDIPAATQLFTPRWIVTWIVQNTLGRHWLQMHPDSRLDEQWSYLVPLNNELSHTELKLAREITVLDPACGTMHFGLVAFDLLAAMYAEELERAGEPGWPATPSVQRVDEIAASIVEHNLYGIDIDLRAVQLAALTLYVKAKSLNPKATIRHSNLACADVLLLNGARLDAFVQAMRFTRPVYERVIRAMWNRLRDANQIGSLLRVEQEIRALVERERQEQKRELPLFPDHERFGDAYTAAEDFWDVLDAQIVQAFDEFARQQAQHGIDETFFAGEATKGLRLLNLMLRRYDVVVANPPYMSNRNMNDTLSGYLKANYPRAKGDLYAAFIQRCADFVQPGGRLGMITQQSFMFIGSYEDLRGDLLGSMAIETVGHLGPRAFEEIGGEKVNTVMFALRSEPNDSIRKHAAATYFRLVREPDARAKRLRFEQAVVSLHENRRDPIVYHYRQADFEAIPGAPWVYWITPGLRATFDTLPPLRQIGQPIVGCFTCDNIRFLRMWWEIGRDHIDRDSASRHDHQKQGKRWFPYMKGGALRRWYGNQSFVVNYFEDGQEIREHRIEVGQSYSLPGQDFYFRRGVTWTDLTPGSFNARLSPGGFVFDVKGSSAFPDNIPLVLGLLNSSFADYCLRLLNPTVSYQSGDLARLPIPTTSSPTLANLVKQAIDLAKQDSVEDETTYDFVQPPAWPNGGVEVAARHARLRDIEREIDEEVYRLYGIAGEDRAAIEAELGEALTPAFGDPSPAAAGEGENGAVSEGENGAVSEGEEETPSPIAMGEGAGGEGLSHVLAQRWISYAIGIAMGRFQPGVDGGLGRGTWSAEQAAALGALVDHDGIVVLEDGHPDALGVKLERALEIMLGVDAAAQVIATATGGKRLHDYLARDWWKLHVQQYRKRPVYWLLQSPKRAWSILVFHERLTRDSLFLLQGDQYLGGKINAARLRANELNDTAQKLPQGKARRDAEKRRDDVLNQLADLQAFDQLLKAITGQTDETGKVVGWQPEIDDGVLLNLAPLHAIVPSWSAEPKKVWQALARGDYDWAHTAMRYWPNRVRTKCRSNKSYAIAHGLE